jgi:glycosyltransferase involved in cell wall biosynthesis
VVDNEPLVSIIVPVRDGAAFIGDALASALGQTYRNTELIVVDDGSRDSTRVIVDRWAERDSRVRVFAQANQGVAAARNRALAAARGELIATLDADDLWDPTKIERQVQRMLEGGETIGLVYCWWVSIGSDGTLLDSSPRWRFEGMGADAMLEVNYTGNASVPLFRRHYLDLAGGYDATLRERDGEGCEDLDIALKVAEQSRVAVVPAWLVGYRRGGATLSARTDRMWRSYLMVLQASTRRRPGLASTVIRKSQHQFALYLAGVAFRTGAYGNAIRWGRRAWRSSLGLQVLLPVIWLLLRTLLRSGRSAERIIGPGVRFSGWEMPRPPIPYGRIYERRFKRLLRE